jgi:hypothetical protein
MKTSIAIHLYMIQYSFSNSQINIIKNIIAKLLLGLIFGFAMRYWEVVNIVYIKNNISSLLEFITILYTKPLVSIIKILYNAILIIIADYYIFHGKGMSRMLVIINKY